ncbi:hypothetical protein AYO21_04508 [Fonsecaea monophora]|uniref:Uncharacterized protein n=1 Tax=Fonsecaea monophora TaxID=254056 RepID=A0A177FAV3_9EURO|nr:hypothetical protein AYO21_04508 [Fonsecaea monophora]OAG41345.1 hypothetical protein AYO21_04508 [Fonsecaea monophora]
MDQPLGCARADAVNKNKVHQHKCQEQVPEALCHPPSRRHDQSPEEAAHMESPRIRHEQTDFGGAIVITASDLYPSLGASTHVSLTPSTVCALLEDCFMRSFPLFCLAVMFRWRPMLSSVRFNGLTRTCVDFGSSIDPTFAFIETTVPQRPDDAEARSPAETAGHRHPKEKVTVGGYIEETVLLLSPVLAGDGCVEQG